MVVLEGKFGLSLRGLRAGGGKEKEERQALTQIKLINSASMLLSCPLTATNFKNIDACSEFKFLRNSSSFTSSVSCKNSSIA